MITRKKIKGTGLTMITYSKGAAPKGDIIPIEINEKQGKLIAKELVRFLIRDRR